MELDHFEEAVRFLRSALRSTVRDDADARFILRYDIERALQHVEDGRQRLATQQAKGT